MRPGKKFVVKVQLSVYTQHAKRQMLVYNRTQKVMWQGDVSDVTVEALGDELKSFWWATMNRRGEIVLLEPAPWQEW